MNNQFDELAKGLAQSGTRRQTLNKFGVGSSARRWPVSGWRTALKPRHSTANAIDQIMDATPLVPH
jgi:hypothetical protein